MRSIDGQIDDVTVQSDIISLAGSSGIGLLPTEFVLAQWTLNAVSTLTYVLHMKQVRIVRYLSIDGNGCRNSGIYCYA